MENKELNRKQYRVFPVKLKAEIIYWNDAGLSDVEFNIAVEKQRKKEIKDIVFVKNNHPSCG